MCTLHRSSRHPSCIGIPFSVVCSIDHRRSALQCIPIPVGCNTWVCATFHTHATCLHHPDEAYQSETRIHYNHNSYELSGNNSAIQLVSAKVRLFSHEFLGSNDFRLPPPMNTSVSLTACTGTCKFHFIW